MANYRRLPKLYNNNLQLVVNFLSAHADESYTVGQIADAVGKGDRYANVWTAVRTLEERGLIIKADARSNPPRYWVNIYALTGGAG